MAAGRGTRGSGRGPDWRVLPVILVFGLLGYHMRGAFARGTEAVSEVVALWDQYRTLKQENQRLSMLAELAKTSEGRELLLRGREGLLPEGAILVRVTSTAPPEGQPGPRGWRAFFDRLGQRAAEVRQLVARAYWIVARVSRPSFPGEVCQQD
ncbi:MAG: hypothetical protein H5T86_06425 [Armatimonadetes bacterium]|nr:hypothetical protein [Armatimonadota bacterium]